MNREGSVDLATSKRVPIKSAILHLGRARESPVFTVDALPGRDRFRDALRSLSRGSRLAGSVPRRVHTRPSVEGPLVADRGNRLPLAGICGAQTAWSPKCSHF